MISKKLFPIIIFIYFFQYVSERNLNYFKFQKVSKKNVLMHHPSIKKSVVSSTRNKLIFKKTYLAIYQGNLLISKLGNHLIRCINCITLQYCKCNNHLNRLANINYIYLCLFLSFLFKSRQRLSSISYLVFQLREDEQPALRITFSTTGDPRNS